MKYINIKTGENLGNDLDAAITELCMGRPCDECEIWQYREAVFGKIPSVDCTEFSEKNPDLALALIGIAAVPDDEDSGQNADAPSRTVRLSTAPRS